jgi:histidinol-phosphatase (PHP family)
MPVSFHGCHSGEFCDHAQAGVTLVDIVDGRIINGFSMFGMSEHMPRDREAFLYPEEQARRRTPESLRAAFNAYVAEAARLQGFYAEQGVHILVGFETEYCHEGYPAWINRLRDESGVDYIVGSVHHVHGIPFDSDEACYREAVERCGGAEQLYAAYYEQQLDLIEQCRPEVIGHFDLIKIFLHQLNTTGAGLDLPIAVSRQIDRNIEAVIAYGGVFEVNSRAFAKGLGEPYPGMELLRRIRELGGEVTLGDDSHAVDDIGRDLDRAAAYIRQAGFERIVAFRKRDQCIRDKNSPTSHLEKISMDLR